MVALTNFLARRVTSWFVITRKLVLALLASAALTPALASTPTLAASGDASATEAYVRANRVLVLDGRTKMVRSEAVLRNLLHTLSHECAGLVADSPQDEPSEKLTWELIGIMRVVAYELGHGAIARFANSVSRLRLSNTSLTREVHTYARQLSALAHMSAPNMCEELRTWKANGYMALPATTVRFNQAFYANYVGIGFEPAQLNSFASGSQRSVLRQTKKVEEELAESEARDVETWGEIMDALGLKQ